MYGNECLEFGALAGIRQMIQKYQVFPVYQILLNQKVPTKNAEISGLLSYSQK